MCRSNLISTSAPILEAMFTKLARRARLDEADRQALLATPFSVRAVSAHRYLVREGDRSASATLILTGLCYRQKVTVEGARQILSVHIPGDFVDLENCLLSVADHSVQALTDCQVAVFDRHHLIDLIDNHPPIGRAMWIDTLIDSSVFREWIVNVGRRDARSGMAHLLCEFARRLEVAGLGEKSSYELPMTQEQLADALGLTPVHVNRVLKEFDSQGLIIRERRFVRIPSWEKLRDAAGFNEQYLHLDQVTPFPASALPDQRSRQTSM